LLWSARGVAEPAPDADAKERARELYERAADAYARKQNHEAIELFTAAAKLTPNPLFSHNIALAYEDLGDVRNALRHYRDYLRSAEPIADRDDVDRRIADLELRLSELGVQQLTVISRPPQAIVFLDETPVGVTPFTGELAPGNHRIRLERDGHHPTRADVRLLPQRSAEVILELEPRMREAPEPSKAGEVSDRVTASPSPLARVKPLSWALLGTGAGSLTGALFFELSRASSARQADAAAAPVDEARARGAADAKQSASLLLFGVGGAFTVAGGILTVLDVVNTTPRHDATNAQRGITLSAACLPEMCGAAASGHF
jgi:tetratricopeptide (TPR) repeat protein